MYEHVDCQENAVSDYAFISIKVETGISDATIPQWNLFQRVPTQVFISGDLRESRKAFFNLGQHSVYIFATVKCWIMWRNVNKECVEKIKLLIETTWVQTCLIKPLSFLGMLGVVS